MELPEEIESDDDVDEIHIPTERIQNPMNEDKNNDKNNNNDPHLKKNESSNSIIRNVDDYYNMVYNNQEKYLKSKEADSQISMFERVYRQQMAQQQQQPHLNSSNLSSAKLSSTNSLNNFRNSPERSPKQQHNNGNKTPENLISRNSQINSKSNNNNEMEMSTIVDENQQQQKITNQFDFLPDEILYRIWTYLDAPSLGQSARVNKRF